MLYLVLGRFSSFWLVFLHKNKEQNEVKSQVALHNIFERDRTSQNSRDFNQRLKGETCSGLCKGKHGKQKWVTNRLLQRKKESK